MKNILTGLAALSMAAVGAAQTFTIFQVNGNPTEAAAINSSGEVTGLYTDTQAHGYVRAANGTITSFDPTGSSRTYPTAINASGVVTGFYTIAPPAMPMVSSAAHPARLKLAHASVRAVDLCALLKAPSVSSLSPDSRSLPQRKPGNAAPSGAPPAGYVRDASDNFSQFTLGYGLYPAGINDAGVVAGTYLDFSQYTHGFYREATGALITFDAPTLGLPYTQVSGINKNGVIVGTSDEGAFIYTP